MKNRRTVLSNIFAILIFSVWGAFVFHLHASLAYSLSDAPPADGTGVDLFAPFTNFISNIRSINMNSMPLPKISPAVPSFSSRPDGNFLGGWVREGLSRLDFWLYGIMGFHISGVFTVFLNLFSAVLGILKKAVDWLLGVLSQ